MRRFTLAVAAALAAHSAPARACSVEADYFPPSNYELVQLAHAAVIATAQDSYSDGQSSGLVFRVDSAIKGTPPRHVRIPHARFTAAQPSDPENLTRPHPDSLSGMCHRTSFARGARYVLLLDRGPNGRWFYPPFPFSRNAEDYDGKRNSWMRAVRRYVRLQATLQPMEQIAALRRLADTGREGRHRLSEAERGDVRGHLATISPWKPTPFLLDLHARLGRGERLPLLLHSREAVDLRILRALAVGEHPGASPLIERLWSEAQPGARSRGALLLYLARNGDYPRAYRWIEERLLAELPLHSKRDAGALLRFVNAVHTPDRWRDVRPGWREDARAAATWPELALALYWYQAGALPGDPAIMPGDAIEAIPPADPRARPALTLALAGGFGPRADEIRSWAAAELQRPGRPQPPRGRTWGDDEDSPDMLPLRVLAGSSYSSDARTRLTRAYCEGGERRRLVILVLGRWAADESLLRRIAAVPYTSAEERSWLLRAAVEAAARDIDRSGDGNYTQEGEERRWPLTPLLRGGAPEAEPIACPVAAGE
ncbi:MAG TPA: hypothetical protein VEZ20_00520 [Allosphingosinicella sp.]|nr:hypothetical protein [Allosphingosinicella sp.]